MTSREVLKVSGYLFAFAPGVLIALGTYCLQPYLPFIGLILLAPFLRTVFGDFAESAAPEWSESAAEFLDVLPLLVGEFYLLAFAYCIAHVKQLEQVSRFGTLLGIWTSSLFASCVAHELLHRKGLVARALGRLIAGAMGYPLLEHEHRAHHASDGGIRQAEWPHSSESVWQFSVRRFRRTIQTAWQGDKAAALRKGNRLAGGLPVSVTASCVSLGLFYLFGGPSGASIYLMQALATAWGMHAMTYVQHWGLGRDENDPERYAALAWEDTCKVQIWLTFGIPYHQGHHTKNVRPYYRLAPTEGSPRQAAGYVVLLVACCIPFAWRTLMTPALETWRAGHRPLSAGRRLICIRRT